MVYLLVFLALVIVARILGPIRGYSDPEQEQRHAEYEHRAAVYGNPESE